MTSSRQGRGALGYGAAALMTPSTPDRKSTRLNSSHSQISYAVFCLKKKKNSTTLLEYGGDRLPERHLHDKSPLFDVSLIRMRHGRYRVLNICDTEYLFSFLRLVDMC